MALRAFVLLGIYLTAFSSGLLMRTLPAWGGVVLLFSGCALLLLSLFLILECGDD